MIDPYQLTKSLHGMFAALLLVALLHPFFWKRRLSRWSIGLTIFVALTMLALGVSIYPEYRRTVKLERLWEAPLAARWFETKEHLGFYIGVLVVAGGILEAKGETEGRWMLKAALFLAGGSWTIGWLIGSVTTG